MSISLRTHKRRACAGMTRRIDLAIYGMRKRPGLRVWVGWQRSVDRFTGATRWSACSITRSRI